MKLRKKNTVIIWICISLAVTCANVALFIKDSVNSFEKAASLATAFVGTAGVQVGYSGPANLLIKLVNGDKRYRIVRYETRREEKIVQRSQFELREGFVVSEIFPINLEYQSKIAGLDTRILVAISDLAVLFIFIKSFLIVLIGILAWRAIVFIEEKKARYQIASERWNIANQVAHDLRSPLSAITLISRSVADLSPQHSDLLTGSVLRLQKIADDLLAIPPKAELLIDCDQLIKSLISEKAAIWPDLNFKLDLKAGIQFAKHDFLLRAIENLLNNSHEAGAQWIKVTSRYLSGALLIDVADNGGGMDSGTLRRAGQKHFTSKVSGHGLGLSYVKNEVEKLNGEVSVLSDVSKGTTVKLKIPISSG